MATQQFNPQTGRRGIEWTDSTRNAMGGCLHGCRWTMPDGTLAVCYAETLAEQGLAKGGYPDGFAHHYWRGETGLRGLVAGGAPELVFCDSMSDMFGSWVPVEQVAAVLEAMGTRGAHHTYQSLTKAPKRIGKFLALLPANLWVGVSSPPDVFMGRELSADQKTRYMHSTLQALAEVKEQTGNIVWMSIEPLSHDISPILAQYPGVLDWAIIGAASDGRRYIQPHAAHVDALLDVVDAGRVPIFYKGNIKPLFETWDFGTAAKNRWREDFPTRPVPRATHPGASPAVIRRQRQARAHGWTLNTFLADEQPAGDDRPYLRPPLQASLF